MSEKGLRIAVLLFYNICFVNAYYAHYVLLLKYHFIGGLF